MWLRSHRYFQEGKKQSRETFYLKWPSTKSWKLDWTCPSLPAYFLFILFQLCNDAANLPLHLIPAALSPLQ